MSVVTGELFRMKLGGWNRQPISPPSDLCDDSTTFVTVQTTTGVLTVTSRFARIVAIRASGADHRPESPAGIVGRGNGPAPDSVASRRYVPDRPPVFSHNARSGDRHRPVGRLAHVVHRQRRVRQACSASISTPVRSTQSTCASMVDVIVTHLEVHRHARRSSAGGTAGSCRRFAWPPGFRRRAPPTTRRPSSPRG